MKIHFYLHYRTRPGENLCIEFLSDHFAGKIVPMQYLNDEFWYLHFEVPALSAAVSALQLEYRYCLDDHSAIPHRKSEWGSRCLHIELPCPDDWEVFDYWNAAGAYENAFLTQPFQQILLKNTTLHAKKAENQAFTHHFMVKAPLLQPDEVPCLLGHGVALRQWDTLAPLLLSRRCTNCSDWELRLDLSREDFPLAYKYGVWNTRTQRFVTFEMGSNRSLFVPSGRVCRTVLHDGFIRLPYDRWRGAGVAIPVFSLRSEKSYGVGEFTDLPLLADWAKSVGLQLIQLLPINDTSATGTWTDSYPYAAISAFALHPIYLNVSAVAGSKHAALLKNFKKKQRRLNTLPTVDYEAVLSEKWSAIRLLFSAMQAEWAKDADYLQYFDENRHWLLPYAAFCCFKNKYGTADFNQWTAEDRHFDLPKIEKLAAAPDADELRIHLFVQWHLHLQLKAAVDYIHRQGLVLKGDIPIGIYRYSCDAWMAPQLYNMHQQAGAPPDDFAEKGQNWGFPTYNWQRMKADGFAWWRQRFAQMSLYFDAFRIDHILGFFRIWSIPTHAVEGILGIFVPAVPVEEFEIRETGLPLERLTQPYIDVPLLNDMFGEQAQEIRNRFLESKGRGLFAFKQEFATQRAIEALTDVSPELKKALYYLLSNVILLQQTDGTLHFRYGIEKTISFQRLGKWQQQYLKDVYNHYFYKRQDEFWKAEAWEKLPALKRTTNMLICGEDLGMVPACVPGVMQELGILSLEIQRMPKKWGATFFRPAESPYLAVVTPSTHDMSTIRGWWEENHSLSQRFFNEEMGQTGEAPFFCEPWINQIIVAQHLHAPAMWAIFQWQDLMGIDADLRRDNPHEERINIPANPQHYWRYRMHMTLENLLTQQHFNFVLKKMMQDSGRC